MYNRLTHIKVRPEVEQFFMGSFRLGGGKEIYFDYGAGVEHCCSRFHQVPALRGFWRWPENDVRLMKRLIICTSAIEAISWLEVYFDSISQLNNLMFIATGVIPDQSFYDFIELRQKTSKVELIFGKGLLDRITDLKVALRLRHRDCQVRFLNSNDIQVEYRSKIIEFSQDKLSLNAFETMSGFRSGIRTHKPKCHNSFFDQIRR